MEPSATGEKVVAGISVPSARIKVSGKDLVRELLLTVTSVEVDLKMKSSGRFSFSVSNVFDWEAREFLAKAGDEKIDLLSLFAFGSPIQIWLGYDDHGPLTLMFDGLITEINTNFVEGGTPELNIAGYDKLYLLTSGKKTRHWEEVKDSDVVEDILSITGLSTDITQTNPEKIRIDQSQITDMVFLEKLASRNKATYYTILNDFYFGPRKECAQAKTELRWGSELMSFSPEANLAKQLETVEVYGWSNLGEAIVGTATSTEVEGCDDRKSGTSISGGEHIARALKNQPAMRVRTSVQTQAEADELARSILKERTQEFLKGNAESVGIPSILPDTTVSFQGIGGSFSKTYYVNAATHTIDSNGYRTSFSVEEPKA